MHSVFRRESIDKIQPDWVVTDNTTLTDAAIVFAALENGRLPDSTPKYLNWLSFLEAAVLHEVTLADDRIFRHQPRIQTMKSAIGDYIAGLDLGNETRTEMKQEVRTFVEPLKNKLLSQLESIRFDVEKTNHNTKEQVFNRANSDLHRSLFYISLASSVGLAYRSAHSRERVFRTILERTAEDSLLQPRDIETELTSGLLQRVLCSASSYSEYVRSLGGPTMVVADLPPLAAMVVSTAKRIGTYAEALYEIRNSKALKNFRRWVKDVVGCLHTGDGRGVRLLQKTNQFIDGWSSDPDEGLKHVTRSIGIGKFHSSMDFSLKYQFRDPVLKKPSHLLFLSQVFKSTVSLYGGLNPKGIPLKK